ncbi:MAG: DUF697 domain-containing protein [Bacteroidota bacterium]
MDNRNLDEINEKADKVIRNHIVWSMGAGLIPIPVADFFAVSAVQLDMIRQLCKKYGVDFKETEGKAVITSLVGSGMARLGAGAVKVIPGVGSLLGGVTMSILSGASTFALGQVFKRHFMTGGTFLDFDVDRLRKYYQEQFEKGKKVARDIQKEEEVKKSKPKENGKKKEEEEEARARMAEDAAKEEEEKNMDSTLERLKELSKMRDDGIISEEEFNKMKKKLVDDF